jgi:hypothetical protein
MRILGTRVEPDRSFGTLSSPQHNRILDAATLHRVENDGLN